MVLYYVFLYRIPEGNPHCQQLLGLDMDIFFCVIITEMGGGGGRGSSWAAGLGGDQPPPMPWTTKITPDMCICVYVCKRVCVYMCKCIHVHVGYLCVYTTIYHVCICVYVYECVYVHMCIS